MFHSNVHQTKVNFFVSTAEKKLLIVVCYYIFTLVIALINFSLSTQVSDTLQTELINYFLCEQNGLNLNMPCSRASFENLINPGLIILSSSLAYLMPSVNFVFVVDYQEVKEKLTSLFLKNNQPLTVSQSVTTSV